MAIFYTIKWYKSDKFWDLIKIAFSISFAIMTKIDAALIAILIGIVFLVKIIKNRKEIKKYILYFSVFLIISLPIGLWYPIKNLVLYDIPVTYVQAVEKDSPMNVEEFSKVERLFKVSLRDIYKKINIEMAGKNRDYNILMTTLKTVVVDECIDYELDTEQNITMYKILERVMYILFTVLIVIAVIYIVNLIYIFKNFKKINNYWILFFFGLLIIETFSYIRFCFKYPFVCTMNFRYIIPTLISFAVLTGIASENNKVLFNINRIVLSVFCIFSVIMFFLIK